MRYLIFLYYEANPKGYRLLMVHPLTADADQPPSDCIPFAASMDYGHVLLCLSATSLSVHGTSLPAQMRFIYLCTYTLFAYAATITTYVCDRPAPFPFKTGCP